MADDITFTRRELSAVLPRYTIVRDCVEQLVKDKGAVYLPQPSTEADQADNDARYLAYLTRAVFYAVTARTLLGMVGQVYASIVDIQLPPQLEIMRNDATGSGLSLEQLSKDTCYDTVALGRAGLYVDFPATNGPVTKKQVDDGLIRPTLTTYRPEAIINWREERRGAKLVKTLVVLTEMIDTQGAYAIEQIVQFRELRCDDSVYSVQLWRFATTRDANGKEIRTIGKYGEPIIPTDAQGKTFDEIPFEFVGSLNNDATVDAPPLYDLAELNIAHYRNSADYEESCFIVGQPTPWFSGLTEEWVTDVLKGKVLLGSRAAVLLPENGMAGLLQVTANSMPMEAMKHKEAQMVALGARLVENRAVRRTLGEVQQSNASETSILASCANNVSAAYTKQLQRAARFVGADPSECGFTLPTDFAMTSLSGEARMQLIADMQAGALSYTEVRTQLRRAGIATQDDATAKAESEADAEAQAKRDAAAQPQPAPAAPGTKPTPIDNRAK